MPDGLFAKIGTGTTYDPDRKQFKQGGKVISRAATRAKIDKLTAHISKEAAKIGDRYSKGRIGIAGFESEMRTLLKSAHIISASVGRGGRDRMTQSDWAKVGNRLKKEYSYLSLFSRKLQRGTLSKAYTANRAKLYASSVVMSYHETVHKEATQNSVSDVKVRLVQNSKEGCVECNADAARGWVNVEDLDEIGTRICQNFCLCEILFSDLENE